MSRNPEGYYRVYKIPKYGKGYRQIEAPRRFLKLTQRWIHDYILSQVQIPSVVHGFVRGRDIFTNAEPHLKHKNIMVVDIKDFFPSIKAKRVSHIYRELGFPVKVANRLTGLCTFNGRLPQGAPTSPTLANIVFSPTDATLVNLAKEWDCEYTRYADDLVFSGERYFSKKDMLQVIRIVEEAGFKINIRKSRIIGSGARQIVAGLVVNQKGLPPRYKRMQWRAIFHQSALSPQKYRGDGLRLTGIAAFVNRYDKALASRYMEIGNRVKEEESTSS